MPIVSQTNEYKVIKIDDRTAMLIVNRYMSDEEMMEVIKHICHLGVNQ